MKRNKKQLPRYGADLAAAALVAPLLGACAVGAEPAAAATAGFNATGSLITGREHATATVLKDGEVLVAGGQDASGAPLSSASLYDPSNGSWTATGPLPLPVSQATAILLADGDILVAGGLTESSGSLSATAASELYDPTTSTWSATKGPLQTASFGASAAPVPSSGDVVYAGGLTSTASGATATAVSELYDASAGTWSTTGPLPLGVARAEMSALSTGNVLLAGGETGASGSLTALAAVYQPSAQAWNAVAHMPTAVAQATTTLLPGHDVLVAGGETATSGAPTATTQLFDPSTSTWSAAGDLPTATYGSTATLLASGEVLYAGGMTAGSGVPTKAAALFNTAANSWTATTDMLVARGFGVAAGLGDGNVLIAGGQTTSGVTTEAELYLAGAAPSFTSASSIRLEPGVHTSFTVTTSGSPTPVLTESGTLPPGLVFQASTDGTATISGTPPANAAGTYQVTITATNGLGTVAEDLAITFYGTAPAITSSPRLILQPGVYWLFTVTTSGSPAPVLTESGALPPGVAFRPNGNGTASIYGTPPGNVIGTYQVTITATNEVGNPAHQDLVISFGHAPAITSSARLVLLPGAYSAFTVTTSGSPTPVLTESGALPAGLVIRYNNNGTATIYGTPSANATGVYEVSFTATNGVGNPAVQYLVVTFGRAPAITSEASLVLHRGVYSAFTVATSGTPTPVVTESGALPPGMVFRYNGNGTASIYGAPAANATGAYDLTITAANGFGSPAVQHLVISFYLPAPGYWLATANGQVYGLGAASSYSGAPVSAVTGAVVGIAPTPSAKGYWVVTANGTVAALGDAHYYGDLPGLGKHVADIVAIAPTSDGNGYYLVGADGGFFTFGDARFHGSLPGIHVHVRDIVGMVATPGGSGYMLVGADGGVFSFGSSRFYGSLPGLGIRVHDVRAILPSSTAKGYVLVGTDGGVFNFGSGVKFYGSLPGTGVKVSDIVGIALTPDDGGYYMAGADGRVYGFGNAHPWAEPAGLSSNLPVAAIAGT